jgi:nickel superoxide dismutase
VFHRLIKPVYAHCDLPCGIYEADSAKHAAATCMRMIEKIESLGERDTDEKQANFVRAVQIKDTHAQKVKQELYVLWSDYFKPEHIAQFPDLHTTMWTAIKQASTVKQTVSKEECQKLIDAVTAIDVMFAESKK